MKKQFVWMTSIVIILAGSTLVLAAASQSMTPQAIRQVMRKVADWQLKTPNRHNPADWTYGALYTGLTAWAQMAEDDQYYQALLGYGEKNKWQPYRRLYMADDHCVGQMYIEMYKKYQDPKMIAGIQKCFDTILAKPATNSLKFGVKGCTDRWSWCDSLFMAPPVWAKLGRITGQDKYIDFLLKEWKATTDYLYDTEEHLYYRDDRYMPKREANGKKVFWSRGNGWSYAGLVRVLEELDENHPNRPALVNQYQQMSEKLVAILPPEGMWHSSLLDPVSYPTIEASGSGFFCYGLAWGINQGYLDAGQYGPVVNKIWNKLVSCVHDDGKLGYVQPVGADPRRVTSDMTDIYGVGAFLLAGSEIYKISVRNDQPVKKVVITNPLIEFRQQETVELDWAALKKSVRGLTAQNAAVFDFKSNHLLVCQVIEEPGRSQLLVQLDMAPGEKKYLWVMAQPDQLPVAQSSLTTFGRFVPERMDDFAWESDKIAYRMYGKALEVETVSSGIDIWFKRVSYPIVDKFYKGGDYHNEHGEGGDFYKVGNSLGCGGTAVYGKDGKLGMSRNFHDSKVIASGPIRTVFELSYDQWDGGGYTLSETKRISIDLGSNMNRIESHYKTQSKILPLASGILIKDKKGQTVLKAQDGWIAFWEDIAPHGNVGCGVVIPNRTDLVGLKTDGHIILTRQCQADKPVIYYAGAGWDQTEEFSTFVKWQTYLKSFKRRVENPLQIMML